MYKTKGIGLHFLHFSRFLNHRCKTDISLPFQIHSYSVKCANLTQLFLDPIVFDQHLSVLDRLLLSIS